MIMTTVQEWHDYLMANGLQEEAIRPYLISIEKQLENRVPVILDFEHLCLLLGVNKPYLASVINSPNNHWRSFSIKKRSGGKREISVPYSSLLYVQRWIYNNILLKIPVSPYSHGFVKKKSIVTNAKWHLKQDELLKLDLSNFFPSIGINRIIAIFHSLGYDKSVSFYLASICCLNEALPQGAPTSPYLSNLVCRPLDYRIIKLAKKNGLHYTRYADDLTLSGDVIRPSLISCVKRIVEDTGFKLNEEKTRLYKRKCQRIVTGVCVSDKLTVPREFKRSIKQEMHYIKKYGLIDHLEKTKCKKRHYCQSLLGRICFWLQVEPKNEFALQSKNHIIKLMRSGLENY